MTTAKLTIAKIREMIKGNPRIDQEIEQDQDTIAVYTNYGWTWDNLEDRHVEVLKIGDYEPDSIEYFQHCIDNIEEDTNEI